jgi:splicing suppressor protein 51
VLKQCDGCQTVYCSYECYEANKAEYPRLDDINPPPPPDPWYDPATYEATQGLHAAPGQPFTRLKHGTYLHNRPRLDVFRLLLDCYRLRLDDDIKIWGTAMPADAPHDFRRFLNLAAERPNLLPPWWDEMAQIECLTLSEPHESDPPDAWDTLARRVSSKEINTHYGHAYMDVQLRLLGEVIYQRAPGNQKGKEILEMMVDQERRVAEEEVNALFGV